MIKKFIPVPVKDFLKSPQMQIKKSIRKLGITSRDLWTIENATFKDDGLITAHNSDFLKDPRFLRAYSIGRNPKVGFDIQWRAYICCWAAERGMKLEGDFVECGVEKGIYSLTIMNYINFNSLNKRFYLLDTFCGFPDRYKHLAASINIGEYYDCYEETVERFKNFKNVEIIRGIIPDALPQVRSDKICYLSIDMNCAEPEIEAVEYFWNRLVKGAVIVLDDYGYSEYYRRQTNAFNEFAERKNIDILALPTGQGLIIKI